ncbi:hypothetical protein PAXRUDRAFT_688936 [Paxillus rubicundulus Ve08.2h10]|uniref:Uncharacterized protein n=1 Tax=Paxillus rubicundulus Ve08.2h10 TaxID=930991 RepID=A0A0D0DY21_9AGAM|nr:hypothetical protein PAXRUDRAFT_688936 [Paxillus rubicundulus Ve08.2h10]
MRNNTFLCHASLGVCSGRRPFLFVVSCAPEWSFFVSASAGSFGVFVPPPSWLFRRVSARSRAQKVRPPFPFPHSLFQKRFPRIPTPFAQIRDLSNPNILYLIFILRNRQSRDLAFGRPKACPSPPHTPNRIHIRFA